MATVLFINRTDLVRNSIMDGNVDTDKFIFFISTAQKIHIQEYLGTKMYNGLTAAIVAGIDLPANARWKLLLDDYVVDMLIWFTQVDYLPWASYQLRNGGMMKHRSENAETVSKEEIQNGILEDLSILWVLIKLYTRNIQIILTTIFTLVMMQLLTVGYYDLQTKRKNFRKAKGLFKKKR